ncbi:hypothetical protein GCM10025858_22830 [Alicyclobacillus sacchari]|uniref:hypothetical protein n=1 Tax=Alicyclobacillus sacchari TaxID=392010 RepID=UPI0023EA4260|nr:hypothetical protein [Alicyclobacillus sacchari]GMA57780.1 hypothetical protein GCM10025858_22830 [Alicyclobacillus sacchari]
MYINFPHMQYPVGMLAHDLGRRRIAFLGPLHLNLIHRTKPWVAIAWSWFMPGFGHLLLGQYLLGWILFGWEVAVNVETHFNVAILETFTGHFTAAKQVLSHEQIGFLLFTYGPIFVFAMHHSYLIARDGNLLTDIGQGAAPACHVHSANRVELLVQEKSGRRLAVVTFGSWRWCHLHPPRPDSVF